MKHNKKILMIATTALFTVGCIGLIGAMKYQNIKTEASDIKETDVAKAGVDASSDCLEGETPYIADENNNLQLVTKGEYEYKGYTISFIQIKNKNTGVYVSDDEQTGDVGYKALFRKVIDCAANGVILVTTKRGKQGAPKISYSGTFGVVDEVSRAKMLNAYQYGQLWNAVRAADPTDVSINLQNDLFQADELNAMKGLNYDLLDKYWKAALTQKHSINMTGGSERANYFGGISYFDQDGNLGNLDYNRWNYRAGVDVKISKWLKASLQVSGDYGKKNKPNVKVGGSNDEKDYNLLLVRPYYIPEEVNGIPIVPYGISNSQVSSSQNYSFSLLQNAGDYNRTETSNMNINAGLEYDFGWNKWLKGLKLKFSYSKSINSTKNNQYGSSYELYYMSKRAGSGNHLYTPIQGQESLYEELLAENNFLLANNGSAINNASGDPYLSRTMSRADNYQMNFTATYNRDFGSHHIGALFSIEKSEAESEYLVGQVTNPYEFTNGQSNLVQYNSASTTEFKRAESGTLSYIGRVNYARSEERRVGKECRSRWSPYH